MIGLQQSFTSGLKYSLWSQQEAASRQDRGRTLWCGFSFAQLQSQGRWDGSCKWAVQQVERLREFALCRLRNPKLCKLEKKGELTVGLEWVSGRALPGPLQEEEESVSLHGQCLVAMWRGIAASVCIHGAQKCHRKTFLSRVADPVFSEHPDTPSCLPLTNSSITVFPVTCSSARTPDLSGEAALSSVRRRLLRSPGLWASGPLTACGGCPWCFLLHL